MKRTKYFGVRVFFFGMFSDPEEWKHEWAKFSQAEKEQFAADVAAHMKQVRRS